MIALSCFSKKVEFPPAAFHLFDKYQAFLVFKKLVQSWIFSVGNYSLIIAILCLSKFVV
jgi:hypothetical protein